MFAQRTTFSKTCLWFTIYLSLITVFLLSLDACGRRGDPVAIKPYEEVGVVKDLKASIRDGNIYLNWGLPESKDFPKEAIKGFVIFRAEVPEGVTVERCDCPFRSLDFIVSDHKKTFEYLDKKAIRGQTYLYKLVVMDKNNRMGEDSNIVLVKGIKPETEEIVITPPKAPTGLIAVYTQKSIVLTWDEVRGQEIKFYRMYRSEGKDFHAIGKTVTFAFTDKNIEPSKKYYYRVTAVGKIEGPPSKEIEVLTEVH